MNKKMAGNNGSSRIVRMIHNITFVRVAALSVLLIAFSATAMAQCGASLTAMATAATSIRNQSQVPPSSIQSGSAAASDSAVNMSIVGL